MTYREQVLAMSDAELVAAVAQRVMGWPATWKVCISLDMNGQPYPRHTWADNWNPLGKDDPRSWGHTMEVVAAMRGKGWGFDMQDSYYENPAENYTEAWFFVGRSYGVSDLAISHATNANPCDTDRQRAILQAALIAVGEPK